MNKVYHLHVDKNASRVVVLQCGKKLEVKPRKFIVAFTQQQGLPGPASDLLTGVAGEDIEVGKTVYFRNGAFYKASFDDPNILNNPQIFFAFSNNSATFGTQIQVKLYGFVNIAGQTLIPNTFYYLGSNGSIIETMPTSGILMIVGQSLNAHDLLINLGNPFLLR